jgi:hypothetical protein
MHWTKPFQALALAGFGLSVTCHFLAITGIVPLFPSKIMLMHGGVFVVFIPAMLAGKSVPRKDFWKVIVDVCPAWVRWVFKVVSTYAFLNFILFMFTAPKGKVPPGDVTSDVVRGFSGHWMFFYFTAFVMLYAEEIRKRHEATETP